MKLVYKSWNSDFVEDAQIFQDLEMLSNGKLKIDTSVPLQKIKSAPAQSRSGGRDKRRQGSGSGGGRRDNNRRPYSKGRSNNNNNKYRKKSNNNSKR